MAGLPGKLDYGELKSGIFKYRLSGLGPEDFEALLEEHVAKRVNLCAYFGEEKNRLFAFNLDGEGGAGVKAAALYTADALARLGLFPLAVKSGHGYHLLCRLESPAENARLSALMDAVKKSVAQRLEAKGADAGELSCTCYPRARAGDISLRLFGSVHARTGEFSSVVRGIAAEDDLLSEEASWKCFEGFMRGCASDAACFERALSAAGV